MKVAAIADVHLGNHRVFAGHRRAGLNDRARAILAVLGQAIVTAHADEAEILAIAGDLFDTSRPPPAHIAAVQETLALLGNKCHVLCGNHDQTSSSPGDNAVAPLGPVATVHEQPGVEGPVVFVPFVNSPAEDYIRAGLEQLSDAASELLVRGEHEERMIHEGRLSRKNL